MTKRGQVLAYSCAAAAVVIFISMRLKTPVSPPSDSGRYPDFLVACEKMPPAPPPTTPDPALLLAAVPDPFRLSRRENGGAEPSGAARKPGSAFEQIDLSSYRLNSIIGEGGTFMAIINDEIVSPGDRIGKLIIKEIRKDRVIAESGSREHVLKLYTDEEESPAAPAHAPGR